MSAFTPVPKPCPKCNGTARIQHETDYLGWRTYFVQCSSCNYKGPRVRVPYGKPEQPYEEKAIRRWNRTAR